MDANVTIVPLLLSRREHSSYFTFSFISSVCLFIASYFSHVSTFADQNLLLLMNKAQSSRAAHSQSRKPGYNTQTHTHKYKDTHTIKNWTLHQKSRHEGWRWDRGTSLLWVNWAPLVWWRSRITAFVWSVKSDGVTVFSALCFNVVGIVPAPLIVTSTGEG